MIVKVLLLEVAKLFSTVPNLVSTFVSNEEIVLLVLTIRTFLYHQVVSLSGYLHQNQILMIGQSTQSAIQGYFGTLIGRNILGQYGIMQWHFSLFALLPKLHMTSMVVLVRLPMLPMVTLFVILPVITALPNFSHNALTPPTL